jgi:hypothetical protein
VDLYADDWLGVRLQDATTEDIARTASDSWALAVNSFSGGLVELTGGLQAEAPLDLANGLLSGVTKNISRDLIVSN